jgi:pyridoxal phosphate enzyme (YggS family)
LASEISKQALKFERCIDILLQVNTSGEASKSGIKPSAAGDLALFVHSLPGVRLVGLMTIPAPADSENAVRKEFALLRSLRLMIHDELGISSCTELSMGMSDDFEVAIEEGATMIRPGTVIFGERHDPTSPSIPQS